MCAVSQQTLGLVIGGLLPAILYGLSGLLVKSSHQIGIGLGPYMVVMGFSVTSVGLVILFAVPDHTISVQSALHTFGSGFLWGIGASLIALSISQFDTPLAKLVPLFNMNTLVAVLLALWVFAEWRQVRVPQLLIGSLLVVVGGALVAKA